MIVGAVLYYWMQNIYITNIKKNLLNEIKLIELTLKFKPNLDHIVKVIKKDVGVRVTFISDSGLVLAESDKDKNSMDNHRYRPEIMEARKNGYGYAVRRSATLKEKMLYVAGKYRYKNRVIYIRLSKEIKKIYSYLMKLSIKIAVILILFFIALFTVVYHTGKGVEREVGKISKFLINLTKKKKKIYISSDFSEEFYKITKLLTKVANILSKRDKQKAKYTARLKEANEQKDDIISAISHEFKNPITVINGYSKTILDDPDIDREIAHKFLQKIHLNGEKLTHLIDTLRLSVKLDADTIKINYSEFDLYELVQEIVETLKVTYKDREIVIKKEFDKKIDADRVLLGVAISNLIENALKYSEDLVEVEIQEDHISIKDLGVGIDKDDMKNITKKFFRVSKNSWNNSLGLGLSIVSNILTLHNYKLEIESKKDQGSCFKIVF